MQTPDAASELFGTALASAEAYVAMLATRGVEWGLIGPRETERLWERHVLNSLAVSRFVGDGASVADVGSGAGLPGIPLALARPDLWVTLIEPLERRASFLALAIDELNLGERVRVVRARAEEHKARYDVVTCRAVAPLEKLLKWTVPLFQPGGRLVAHSVTADSDVVLLQAYRDFGGELTRLSVENAEPLGRFTSFKPLRTVTSWAAIKG